jgi:hypothetical protein
MPAASLSPISVNQQPAHGDKTVLEQTAKATKAGAVSGAVMSAPKAGRPAGRANAQGARGEPPQGAAAQQAAIPQEHVDLIAQLPYAQRAAQQLAQAAQRPDAGPFVRFYAQMAQNAYQRLAMNVRKSTPFFED